MTVAIKKQQQNATRGPSGSPPRAGFKSGQGLEIKASGWRHYHPSETSGLDDLYTPAERRAIDRGIAASEEGLQRGRSMDV